MVKINIKFDQGIPQYACNYCENCNSVFGRSLCSIKNRGCCWYFPKFTLHEIHKMVKDVEGLKVLNMILSLPKTKVYHYYIHAIGYFDEAQYKKYLKQEKIQKPEVRDKSIFFRACPFVKPGKGCTLASRFRSYVCNFFICEEVIKKVENDPRYIKYVSERESYVKWIEWENNSLEMILKENGLNLVNNFNEVVNTLKNIPLENCEFKKLLPIESEEGKIRKLSRKRIKYYKKTISK